MSIETIIPGLIAHWWVILDMSDDVCHLHMGCDGSCEWRITPCRWNRHIMREYNRIPDVYFPTAAAAFADFVAKNPTLIEGETLVPEAHQYVSGKDYKTHTFVYANHRKCTFVLAKNNSTVALLLNKQIIDKSKLPEAMNTAVTLTELECLRATNAALRAEIKATKPAPTFFLPPVSTLKETQEIANAFAAFYGYFIVECSSYVHGASPTSSTGCGFSYGEKVIKDPAGLDCSALTFNNLIGKIRCAHLMSNARILGLTKKVKQQIMITDVVDDCYTGVLRTFLDQVLIEHVETDEDIMCPIESARYDYNRSHEFRSNLPLLRFMNDETRGKNIKEVSIPWVDLLDSEQAEHMLRGMMIGSSEKDNTIELMSPLLATCVEKLCRIAGYSCSIKNIGDMLWVASLTTARDPC